MASNTASTPDVTSWWFRRVLGPDLIKCSSIPAEHNETKRELGVRAVESAMLSTVTKAACEVIGLYFTPVSLCVDEGNTEEFTSKLVNLYDRVNYCSGDVCSGSECYDNKTDEVPITKSTADQQKNEDNCNERLLSSKHRAKTRRLEVVHIVLPGGGNTSALGTNLVFEPGSDSRCMLDEAAFRKVVKDLPWFAIPHRDVHRTVCTLL